MPSKFALVGCGGMGRRHLRGYAELATARPDLVELAAVVDPAADRAEFLAGEAEDILGARPRTFTALPEAIAATPDLAAVDIVTTARTHHDLAVAALDAGLHVLVEKPMAVTMRGCARMRAAAKRSGHILSIAENYRRDPIARLAWALVASGAIGEPRTVLETHAGGGDQTFITAWRHRREEGGPLLDVGVHLTDMLQYLVGPVREVYARTRLAEPERRRRSSPAGPGGFYDRFAVEMPVTVDATAPDSLIATLAFESGAWGQWLQDMAARGAPLGGTVILGSEGRLDLPGVRRGAPLQVWRDSASDPLDDAALLDRVPDFALDDLATRLFGGDRLARYDAEFVAADRRLLALEVAELAGAIETGAAVEVGPEEGGAAVAVVLAALESGAAGTAVSVADVRNGAVSAYQDPIDRMLGLLD